MPTAKDTIMSLGVAAAVAMGAAGLVRGPAAATPGPAASVASGSPSTSPPPPPCREACEELAKWCPAGVAVNCEGLLQRFQADGKVSCADGISADEAASLGWCPDGGAAAPLAM